MDNIKEALEVAGYSVKVIPVVIDDLKETLDTSDYNLTKVHQEKNTHPPVLKCIVDEISFSNYTWLAPIIPTWGGLSVTLQLVNSRGVVLWSKKFDGGGFTFNFFDGYNIASQESMSELLEKMINSFTSDEFYKSISGELETSSVQ